MTTVVFFWKLYVKLIKISVLSKIQTNNILYSKKMCSIVKNYIFVVKLALKV